jgi:hypothetical protein
VIADFSEGKTPETTEIKVIEDNSTLLELMLDEGDRQYAGDFVGQRHSQLMMINCNRTTNKLVPKIIIADFEKGSASARYQENWGESHLFGGWLDANDTQLVGDLMGIGHSQMLFVNHGYSGGKIMIFDFSKGNKHAAIKYSEKWNKGTLFNGWLGLNDTRVAGDFKGHGYSQVLFINSSISGLNATIVELTSDGPMISM